ncbi:MAG: radical SAM protein [Nitrospirae bacterium]|nr:radical SAM protein [Nitrospirota bacterium]
MSSKNLKQYIDQIKQSHPCFSEQAHQRFGRIHLPVAPACNIQCRYCIRKYDCPNESRPGITSRVLSPDEALERVSAVLRKNEQLRVVGIAGPGDALANEATFTVARAINREFPDIILCISTNGLLLPDRLPSILKAGIKSITVTINAVVPEVAEKIYSWVRYRDRLYYDREAATLLTNNQWLGLKMATRAGLIVKVNTVYIPGINDREIPMIAWLAARRKAVLQNIIPLIPQGQFSTLKRPTHEMLMAMRKECEAYLPQMSHCRQCRADACGSLDEDMDMELETLMARIGEQYCEMVM